MSLYSDVEKRVLMQWLFRNNRTAFENTLKLQKFLLFYELFAKDLGTSYNLSGLRAYENGPVFSPVFSDVRYRKAELMAELLGPDIIMPDAIDVCIEAAQKASFLVSTHSKSELSAITHLFDAWRNTYIPNVKHIAIKESDFTVADNALVHELVTMYTLDDIVKSEVLTIGVACFVLDEGVVETLTELQQEGLEELAQSEYVENPMFVTVSEDGVLEID